MFTWLHLGDMFTGSPGLGLARARVRLGLVRSGLSGFQNLLEGERSGFEAVMHKVVHKLTTSSKI